VVPRLFHGPREQMSRAVTRQLTIGISPARETADPKFRGLRRRTRRTIADPTDVQNPTTTPMVHTTAQRRATVVPPRAIVAQLRAMVGEPIAVQLRAMNAVLSDAPCPPMVEGRLVARCLLMVAADTPCLLMAAEAERRRMEVEVVVVPVASVAAVVTLPLLALVAATAVEVAAVMPVDNVNRN
jgi:hypothetical protein